MASVESMLALEQSDDDLDAGAHATPPRRFDRAGQEVDPSDPTRGTYIVTWDVAANTPIEGIRRVKVTVDWETAEGNGFTSLVFHRR